MIVQSWRENLPSRGKGPCRCPKWAGARHIEKAGGSVSHGDTGVRGGREIGLVLVAKERSSDFSINVTESHCWFSKC